MARATSPCVRPAFDLRAKSSCPVTFGGLGRAWSAGKMRLVLRARPGLSKWNVSTAATRWDRSADRSPLDAVPAYPSSMPQFVLGDPGLLVDQQYESIDQCPEWVRSRLLGLLSLVQRGRYSGHPRSGDGSIPALPIGDGRKVHADPIAEGFERPAGCCTGPSNLDAGRIPI
jgi:hypothetical protein